MIDEKLHPQFSTSLKLLFLSKPYSEIRFHKETAILFRPNLANFSKILINHRDRQIVFRSTIKLCFETNVATNSDNAIIEKITISRAIQLRFLRSLVSAIRREAN